MIALLSAYALLVIWHRIQSPRPADASTTAGRNFDCDKSEKGNGTRTIAPAGGTTMLRLPRGDSSPRRAPLHSAALSRRSAAPGPPRGSLRVPAGQPAMRSAPASELGHSR